MSNHTTRDRDVSSATRSLQVRSARPARAKVDGARRFRAIAWSSLPLLVFAAIILLWAALVAVFSIPAYLLPGPFAVFERLITDFGPLWQETQSTLLVLVIGLALSIVISIPLGLVIALSRVARQTVYPPVVLLQLVPKIAVAPLLLVWLGFSLDTKVALVVLISFFPLLMSSISGFSILDERLLYLTRSMGATRWQTFWSLRFPAALPIIFSGIKTSATIAITGALVAEFLGSNTGLGYALLRASGQLDTAYMFAILVILTVIGIVVNYIVEAAEWLLTPWQRRASDR